MQHHPLPAKRPVRVERIEASAYTIPTSSPEADGTLAWDRTTIVIVEAFSGGARSLGYTYADASAAALITHKLAPLIAGGDAMDMGAAWSKMTRAVRNVGLPGVAATAISAVDAALWDLKARLLELPLATLLGRVRESVPIYFSGGFTSYTIPELQKQFAEWKHRGVRRFKMKVGSEPERDAERVRAVREAAGNDCELMVDANGAYTAAQALAQAGRFAEQHVTWFEEPVSSDDLTGLRRVRERAPAGMHIAAGEYGYTPQYFRSMLELRAVDILQADATRCLGITGFLQAAAVADAFHTPLSAHTAPALHAHVCCVVPRLLHVEYFHDHIRIEQMLFEGAPVLVTGSLAPDLTRPGMGLELRRSEARRFAA